MAYCQYFMLLEDHFFCAAVSDDFKCSICLGVIRVPMQLQCEHMYCNQCITAFIQNASRSTHSCPLDRQTASMADVRPAQRNVTNFIDSLHMKCVNYREGCDWEGLLNTLRAHLT